VSTNLIITNIFIFSLAAMLGLEVIRRVPKLLHTPLMALTNALSAIALVASIVVLGENETTYSTIMAFVAVVASAINVVGGFLITEKMMGMFKTRERAAPPPDAAGDGGPGR
jgi:NAD(P) transhydrogenase subunit alpha